MVAAVQDLRDDVVAIHRTYLDRRGIGKADVAKAKMMLGPVAGAAVRLTEAKESLIVAEGIETALSVMLATGLPTWAALSASGIRALELPPLPLAAEVTIAADSDAVGEQAAREAAKRWTREGRVVSIAVPPDGKDFNDILRDHGLERVRELIGGAKLVDGVADAELSDARPRKAIRVNPARYNDCLRAAAAELHDIVFLRGTAPVILTTAGFAVGRDGDDDSDTVELRGVRLRRNAPLLTPARPDLVRFHLDELAIFERRNGKGWSQTPCPKDIAGQVVEAAVKLGFRPCMGIIHVPILLGGKIVSARGYHAASGYYIDGPSLEPLPQNPTKADAERALERLLRPFRGYIDAGTVDRGALAAAALTAVLRPSLSTAPAILIDGNEIGCGKGKLARTLAVFATGMPPATITEGHSNEETEKRIDAAILSGVPAILLDNLQRHLQSSALESGLTEGVAAIRLFGTQQTATVSFRSLVLLTANNATLRRDMLRRTLPVRIVVPDEMPEQRQFDFDPVMEAGRDRADLLRAAFTVVLAWRAVRETPEVQRHRRSLGSFEEWADLIGGAVSWLTGTHPVELIESSRVADPYAAAERQVIDALAAQYGLLRWKAADAAQDFAAELWAAVLPRMKGDKPTAVQVGNWLRARRDRVYGLAMLVGELDRNSVMMWRFVEVPDVRGLRGLAGGNLGSSKPNGHQDGEGDGADDGICDDPDEDTPRNHPQPPQVGARMGQ